MPCQSSSVYRAEASHHELVSLDTCSPRAGPCRNITFRIGPEQYIEGVSKLHKHGQDYLVTYLLQKLFHQLTLGLASSGFTYDQLSREKWLVGRTKLAWFTQGLAHNVGSD